MEKSVSTKSNKSYTCIYCEHSWSRNRDFERHLNTVKHEKKRQEAEKKRQMELQENAIQAANHSKVNNPAQEKTMKTLFCCESCKFTTEDKKESLLHLKSGEHIKISTVSEITIKYVCSKCDKYYDNYKSCWGHSRRCKLPEPVLQEEHEEPGPTINTNSNIDIEAIKKEVYENVVIKMLENNTNIMEKVVEKVTESAGQMLEIANTMKDSVDLVAHQPPQTNLVANIQNNIQTTIQNTDNSITHNHCTVNVFLNEKCKDAMNIFDFISNMNITFDHLYHQADNGFQKGLTKILLDNLKLLSIYNRPIHFTDLKREIMYIKDNDEWTKHEDKEKLVEALEWTAKQGINCFVDWREATAAENEDLDSPTGQMWMKLMQTVVQPYTERMKAYPKIMKEIARNVHLRKEDQA
jgi:hypothetical protein